MFVPNSHSRVCSDHFKEECYKMHGAYKRLKCVLPSVFPSFPPQLLAKPKLARRMLYFTRS